MTQRPWLELGRLTLALLTLTTAAATAAVDADRFHALKSRIETRGSRVRTPDFVLAHLVRLQPDDLSGPHRMFAVSEVSAADAERFRARLFSLVNEAWTIDDDKNWVIDQWIFEADAEGTLRRVSHFAIVESPARVLLKHDPLLVTTEPGAEFERLFNQALEPWYLGTL